MYPIFNSHIHMYLFTMYHMQYLCEGCYFIFFRGSHTLYKCSDIYIVYWSLFKHKRKQIVCNYNIKITLYVVNSILLPQLVTVNCYVKFCVKSKNENIKLNYFPKFLFVPIYLIAHIFCSDKPITKFKDTFPINRFKIF